MPFGMDDVVKKNNLSMKNCLMSLKPYHEECVLCLVLFGYYSFRLAVDCSGVERRWIHILVVFFFGVISAHFVATTLLFHGIVTTGRVICSSAGSISFNLVCPPTLWICNASNNLRSRELHLLEQAPQT